MDLFVDMLCVAHELAVPCTVCSVLHAVLCTVYSVSYAACSQSASCALGRHASGAPTACQTSRRERVDLRICSRTSALRPWPPLPPGPDAAAAESEDEEWEGEVPPLDEAPNPPGGSGTGTPAASPGAAIHVGATRTEARSKPSPRRGLLLPNPLQGSRPIAAPGGSQGRSLRRPQHWARGAWCGEWEGAGMLAPTELMSTQLPLGPMVQAPPRAS